MYTFLNGISLSNDLGWLQSSTVDCGGVLQPFESVIAVLSLLWAHMQFGHISSWVYWRPDNCIYVHWTMDPYAVQSANRSIWPAFRSFSQWWLDRAADKYKSMPYLDPYAVWPAVNAPSCILVQAAYVSAMRVSLPQSSWQTQMAVKELSPHSRLITFYLLEKYKSERNVFNASRVFCAPSLGRLKYSIPNILAYEK